MLQISRATDYALLFLTNLTKRPDRKWSVRQASEELKISRRFLANIVHQLARREIIETSKGAGGGVRLLRKPELITLRDVIEIFEGPVVLMYCRGKNCERMNLCGMHSYWSRMNEKIMDDFESTSIDDLGGN